MAEARSEEDDDTMTRETREQQVSARRQPNTSGGKTGQSVECVTLYSVVGCETGCAA